MGGANLELFKFSVYIFFPIATMYYFGAPEFYDSHVKQIKFWPEKTNVIYFIFLNLFILCHENNFIFFI
uniref:Uncharacterized protein n=1 Tax=Rhizophagus irregularis (strain DAOM 181602 / DAOM 197198 / MUCL 43194) TaxID=747089 RepID=U9TD22_RHIID